ncbi:MAG TPA: transposase [bacterium]|nr:transposase [bacterium]HOM26905.1 transposase [bacterium]
MEEGSLFHVFTKSIAGYKVFKSKVDYRRMVETIWYYMDERTAKFSRVIDLKKENKGEPVVRIICYCIMPTHLHLVLEEKKEKGISQFMSNILNSYARYFNLKYKRKGHLWESSYKRVLVETDEQLLHLTRYIHLNPTTAGIVKKPENWEFSSYREYLGNEKIFLKICYFDDIIEINPKSYREFVEDYIDYEKELHRIKGLVKFESENP